jgi:hypothetical protein
MILFLIALPLPFNPVNPVNPVNPRQKTDNYPEIK